MINSPGQSLPLNNGLSIPGFGYGCYKIQGDELIEDVGTAIECGYRMIDTAAYYGNEEAVGQALKRWPGADELYVVSKIWPDNFDRPVEALEKSLRLLGRDKIDAYLLHWPGKDSALRLKAFEKLQGQQEAGRIGTLGVSNFLESHLRELHKQLGLWAPINQIESHPYYAQTALCDFCHEQGIAVMAWGPLGRTREFADPILESISREAGVSVPQVILRWHIQNGRIPIPKSTHRDRIRENINVFQFSLSPGQMAAINGLSKADGAVGPNPMNFPA